MSSSERERVDRFITDTEYGDESAGGLEATGGELRAVRTPARFDPDSKTLRLTASDCEHAGSQGG